MTPRRKWAGREVKKLRDQWRPRLPVACCRCGRPVIDIPGAPSNGWQVDHWPIPREHGGTETWPAHARCNMSAGGRRGAAITNSRGKIAQKTQIQARSRNIRGV